MSELFSAGELIGKLLGVAKVTGKAVKFAGKAGYGAYAKSKEKEEIARLQRQAAVDETGALERLARSGNLAAQYEYGYNLYNYGETYDLDEDVCEGLRWIKRAADGGHEMAECFLMAFDED